MGLREKVGSWLVKTIGADTISQLVFPGYAGQGPRLGARQMLRAYSVMPWLRAISQKIAHDVATTTWVVAVPENRAGEPIRSRVMQRAKYEQRKKMMKAAESNGALRVLDNHPLTAFLDGANPWFFGLAAMQLSQVHLDLIGELSWIMETNRFGMPTQFVPFPPTWINELPRPDYPFYRIIGPSATRDIPAENILWMYHPNPEQPFTRGTGLGQVLGDELETDEFAAKHVRDWFKFKAIPPVLIAGLGLQLPEMQRVEERWLQKGQRRGGGFAPHFMSRDVKVHNLSSTFADMQLIPLRQHERDTIRQVFGAPPEIFGIVENSNRATIEAAEFIYQRHVIVPRLEFLRAGLQELLLPRFDDRLVLDYVSPVVEDREYALKVMQASPWAFMADEWRQRAGCEELPDKDGKVFWVPFNLTPVRSLATDAPESIWDAPSPTWIGEPVDQDADADADANEDDDNPDDDGAGGGGALPEGKARRRVRGLIGAGQKADIVGRVVAAVKSEPITRRAKPVVRSTIQKFGELALDLVQVSVEFNARDPRIETFLRQWGAERITNMVDQTTKDAIRDQLVIGLENTESTGDLVNRIRGVFEEATRSRAKLIARTEIGRASSFATKEGFTQGGVEQKEWLATMDAEVRDTHAELDGTVVGLDEDFVSASGATAPYPCEFGVAEEDCNCRCGILPVLDDRAFSSEQRTAHWKTIEGDRRPFDRAIMSALRAGFREQERAVIAALDATRGSGRWTSKRRIA